MSVDAQQSHVMGWKMMKYILRFTTIIMGVYQRPVMMQSSRTSALNLPSSPLMRLTLPRSRRAEQLAMAAVIVVLLHLLPLAPCEVLPTQWWMPIGIRSWLLPLEPYLDRAANPTAFFFFTLW